MHQRQRLFSVALLAAASGLLATASALAASPPTTPEAKAAAKPVAKPAPATTRQRLQNQAKGMALAAETAEAISDAQLGVAARVLTGAADCEFNQQVSVLPVDGQPGWFTLSHQGRRYRLLPRETSTGAVRLEGPSTGIVWLQIPAKSIDRKSVV